MVNANLYARYAERFPGETASKQLISTPSGTIYTYLDAERESARLANLLTDLGLMPGDRVSVMVEKSPSFVWLYLACLRAGFIFHPLNTAYTPAEVTYFVGNAEPKVFICSRRLHEKFASILNAANVAHTFTLEADSSGSLSEASAHAAGDFQTVDSAPSDNAALLYSSGTTGKPKGIALTHENLSANADTLTQAWGFREQDNLLHALPLYHVHGLFVALGCVLMSGSSMTFLPKFDLDQVLTALPHCTVMMGVPTFYTRLLASKQFSAAHCAAVRVFISGSAPLREETYRQFKALTGHEILERYGMTETIITASNPLNGKRRVGTVGPALKGFEFRVRNDAGKDLPRDEIGVLHVKGISVFRGYWRMPDKTREDFDDDGYFCTGDQVSIDEDGYLHIVGRAKDLIISGGLNIYPKEIENVLDARPEIMESAVIGLPDDDFGEKLVAIVVAETGKTIDEAVIRDALREELASYKIPKRIIAVLELPRNAMGKVQKNLLREQSWKV